MRVEKTKERLRLHNLLLRVKDDRRWKTLYSGWALIKHLEWVSFFQSQHAKRPYSSREAEQEGAKANRPKPTQEKHYCSNTFQTIEGWVIFLSKIREKNHMLTKAAYAMSHCFTKAKDGRREKRKPNFHHSLFLILPSTDRLESFSHPLLSLNGLKMLL